MYRNDDTQPILIDQHDTMVFAHPAAAAAPQVAVRPSAAQRVLYVLLAVLLLATGGLAGAFLVASSTYTQSEVVSQRSQAEQSGYDAGYEAGTTDAERGAKSQSDRAYDNGYRAGYDAGREAAAAAAAAPAPQPQPDAVPDDQD